MKNTQKDEGVVGNRAMACYIGLRARILPTFNRSDAVPVSGGRRRNAPQTISNENKSEVRRGKRGGVSARDRLMMASSVTPNTEKNQQKRQQRRVESVAKIESIVTSDTTVEIRNKQHKIRDVEAAVNGSTYRMDMNSRWVLKSFC